MYFLSVQCLSKRLLKEFTEGAETTFWGRLFHSLITLILKNLRRHSLTALGLKSFMSCPLVVMEADGVKKTLAVLYAFFSS